MKNPQVLIIGLGGVGGWALELLARTPGISRIVGADINEDWGRKRMCTAEAGVVLQGIPPALEFVKMDLHNIDATAEIIAQMQPQLILNCATQQTWWVRYQHLPPEMIKRLGEAGAGPWLPTHMALARSLMLAIKSSGWKCFVINSGFSDCSNMVLAKRGLAPTIGLGNIDLIVPIIQAGAARRLKVPVSNIQVYAIMHHHHYGSFIKHSSGFPPYFLRIIVGDKDVTGQFDSDQLLHEEMQGYLSSENLNPVVAASGVKNALAMLFDTGLLSHSPGPQGLPGGYPIRLGAHGAEVFLPTGITLEEAVAINNTCQVEDGIASVEDDGTVIYTDKSVQLFKEILDFDLTPLKFDECDERAEELITHFRTLRAMSV
jgi:hypothetical protein